MKGILVLVLLLLSGCLSGKGDSLEMGDYVEIDFTGTVQDTGEVFETTYRDVALNPGVKKTDFFSLAGQYEPIAFTLGEGLVLPALEEGIVGMKVGETEKIVLTPDEAYGEWSSEFVDAMSRTATIPRFYPISTSLFTASFGKEPVLGEKFPLKHGWTAVIMEVSDEGVEVMLDIESQKSIVTDYGQADVAMNDTHIITRLNPEIGTLVSTDFGTGVVYKINETEFDMDFNHPLAGKTLVYEVTVVKDGGTLQK